MADVQLLETNKVQSIQYLYVLNLFLVCYGFTLSPNLYSVFASVGAMMFLGTRNVFVFALVELAACCVPLTYHFLTDDYVLLNMLTYFPYPEEKNYWCMFADVVLVWFLFVVFFATQFLMSKKLNYQQNFNQVLQQLRRDEMR